ncbi:hypothetical protein DID96_06025 [Burkholderia sp. Bp8963]|uniref:hypothetical protein n=1 Tax=Burkholderia sp. Bp8963 TaxID=2184547 RepID=UPI000F5B3D1D|nr:hypothetical protein [Burkholderia sp. Bp8963]RQS74416.1 hypothetical protein DID96_06025 [Burkholderia sp. Bp8963]
MKRNDLITGDVDALAVDHSRQPMLDLSDARDCRIVADALRVLLRERSEALAFAMRVADEHGRSRPDAGEFGLTDIIRIARVVERAERQRRQIAVE